MTETEAMRDALRWYAAKARDIAVHANSGAGAVPLAGLIATLASDAGSRAEKALAQRETDKA